MICQAQVTKSKANSQGANGNHASRLASSAFNAASFGWPAQRTTLRIPPALASPFLPFLLRDQRHPTLGVLAFQAHGKTP
jgi:hypothetical protein